MKRQVAQAQMTRQVAQAQSAHRHCMAVVDSWPKWMLLSIACFLHASHLSKWRRCNTYFHSGLRPSLETHRWWTFPIVAGVPLSSVTKLSLTQDHCAQAEVWMKQARFLSLCNAQSSLASVPLLPRLRSFKVEINSEEVFHTFWQCLPPECESLDIVTYTSSILIFALDETTLWPRLKNLVLRGKSIHVTHLPPTLQTLLMQDCTVYAMEKVPPLQSIISDRHLLKALNKGPGILALQSLQSLIMPNVNLLTSDLHGVAACAHLTLLSVKNIIENIEGLGQCSCPSVETLRLKQHTMATALLRQSFPNVKKCVIGFLLALDVGALPSNLEELIIQNVVTYQHLSLKHFPPRLKRLAILQQDGLYFTVSAEPIHLPMLEHLLLCHCTSKLTLFPDSLRELHMPHATLEIKNRDCLQVICAQKTLYDALDSWDMVQISHTCVQAKTTVTCWQVFGPLSIEPWQPVLKLNGSCYSRSGFLLSDLCKGIKPFCDFDQGGGDREKKNSEAIRSRHIRVFSAIVMAFGTTIVE